MPDSRPATPDTPDGDIPHLDLAIGMPLNLHLTSSREGARITARVLGMMEGTSVLVHLPSSGPASAYLSLDEELTVRCLAGRTAIGFVTRVLRVCTSPFAYYHLAYPRQVKAVQIRQSERVAVSGEATITTSDNRTIQVELRDLSASGAMFRSHEPVGPVGTTFRIAMDLALGDMARSLAFDCTVRSEDDKPENSHDHGRHRYGIEFADVSDADRLFLFAFVYERLLAARSTGAGA
ncbi:MAG: hypothetical protein GC151_14410 [Betaproteobacteria bacterium]|nr:hypothetical protein [Betaproteobacteria bacterium]